MIMTGKDLKQIISKTLFLEGQAESIVSKFPYLLPAYNSGIRKSSEFIWILNMSKYSDIENLIRLVKEFNAKKMLLISKGESTDLNSYKDPHELELAFERSGESRGSVEKRLKTEETDFLGKFGNWIVVMPHTKESSIFWGKGTKWCTSAIKSENLFYNFVGGKDSKTVLYYIINTNKTESRIDSSAKLSIGFMDGKPLLDGGYETVDASDQSITKDRLKIILGEYYETIMNRMEEHSKSIGINHPAKKIIKSLAENFVEAELILKDLQKNEKYGLIEAMLEYEPSQELLIKLSNEDDTFIKLLVAKNIFSPIPVLIRLSQDKDGDVSKAAAKNPTYIKYIESLNHLQERWLRIAGLLK